MIKTILKISFGALILITPVVILAANPTTSIPQIGGDIHVVHSNGSGFWLNATTTTDVGRGTALLTALSSTVVGDSIYLASTTFDIGVNNIDLTKGDTTGLSIYGAGKYNTKIKAKPSTDLVIRVGTNTVVKDLGIYCTNTSGFCLPVGNKTSKVSSSTIENVYISGNTDGIYFQNFDNPGSTIATVRNVSIDTNWDGIFYTELGTINMYDVNITAVASATVNGGLITDAVFNSNGGILNLFNCTMSASGGSANNNGVLDAGGFIYVYGGSITTSGTAAYDLKWNGGGVLGIAPDVVYDDTKTTGAITQLRPRIGIGMVNPNYQLDIYDLDNTGKGIQYTDSVTGSPSFQLGGDLDSPSFSVKMGDVNNLNGHVLATLDVPSEEFRIERGRLNADSGIFGTNRSETSVDGNWAAAFNGEMVIAPGGNGNLADVTIIDGSSFNNDISFGLSVPGRPVDGNLWFSTNKIGDGGGWFPAFTCINKRVCDYFYSLAIASSSPTASFAISKPATSTNPFVEIASTTNAIAQDVYRMDASGNVTQYNATSTATLVNTSVAQNVTGKTAAFAFNTFAPTATTTYQINGYAVVTAVALDIIQPQCIFTDETGTSRTVTLTITGATGSIVSGGISATGYYSSVPLNIRVKANTSVACSVQLTTGTGSITYDTGLDAVALEPVR